MRREYPSVGAIERTGVLCTLYKFSLCIQPKNNGGLRATLQQPEGLFLNCDFIVLI